MISVRELYSSIRYNEAIVELLEFTKTTNVGALCALEIGGGNGMINLISGSTKYLNLPVLDGDFMVSSCLVPH